MSACQPSSSQDPSKHTKEALEACSLPNQKDFSDLQSLRSFASHSIVQKNVNPRNLPLNLEQPMWIKDDYKLQGYGSYLSKRTETEHMLEGYHAKSSADCRQPDEFTLSQPFRRQDS